MNWHKERACPAKWERTRENHWYSNCHSSSSSTLFSYSLVVHSCYTDIVWIQNLPFGWLNLKILGLFRDQLLWLTVWLKVILLLRLLGREWSKVHWVEQKEQSLREEIVWILLWFQLLLHLLPIKYLFQGNNITWSGVDLIIKSMRMDPLESQRLTLGIYFALHPMELVQESVKLSDWLSTVSKLCLTSFLFVSRKDFSRESVWSQCPFLWDLCLVYFYCFSTDLICIPLSLHSLRVDKCLFVSLVNTFLQYEIVQKKEEGNN